DPGRCGRRDLRQLRDEFPHRGGRILYRLGRLLGRRRDLLQLLGRIARDVDFVFFGHVSSLPFCLPGRYFFAVRLGRPAVAACCSHWPSSRAWVSRSSSCCPSVLFSQRSLASRRSASSRSSLSCCCLRSEATHSRVRFTISSR